VPGCGPRHHESAACCRSRRHGPDFRRAGHRIGDKTDTRFSRASLYLGEESSHQLSDTVSFKQRLELYPGLSGDKAKIMKFTAGLGVAMSGTMSLTVGLTDSYNSKPPAGSKKNDVAVFTGLNVKFGAN
jgi:putative salt-induced outer membrane protein